MTLVLGGFCRIGAGAGGGGRPFGSGKCPNCSKLQNIINNEKHCNHSTRLVLYYYHYKIISFWKKNAPKNSNPLEPKHFIYEVDTNWLWFATILVRLWHWQPSEFCLYAKNNSSNQWQFTLHVIVEAKFLNQRVQDQDPVSTMQTTGWTKYSSMDVVARGRFSDSPVCWVIFGMVTPKQPNNGVILEQACSWPVRRQSFGTNFQGY